jgi:hypothetical protein
MLLVCSVLTEFALLFFAILLRVGYGLSVCDLVIRNCIAMLSQNSFHSPVQIVPGSLSKGERQNTRGRTRELAPKMEPCKVVSP